MLTTIKKQFYNLLTKDLKYTVADNPYATKERTFPYVMLTLQDTRRDKHKNSYMYTIKFKIDIFSAYSGEEEILKMEEEIFDKSNQLYENEFVTYVRQSAFRILDDKSTGALRKHGVITYTILCAGGIEDELDNETGA